jgi:hypothetical protein
MEQMDMAPVVGIGAEVRVDQDLPDFFGLLARNGK